MKKIIVVVLVVLLLFGGALNAFVDQQVLGDMPLAEEYLNCTNCLQTVIWVIFLFISGLILLLDPEPLATWLGKIWTKRDNKFALRLMGFFLLALIPLSAYSLTNDCQTFCGLFSK
jgi:hypothetical protein